MARSVLKTVIILYFVIIGLVLIHHQMIHDGNPFQANDFETINLFQSHEGIITVMLIGGAGLMLGVFLEKKYKLT